MLMPITRGFLEVTRMQNKEQHKKKRKWKIVTGRFFSNYKAFSDFFF